jgi:sporulation protein YlmC with PRC-barrel domain
MRLSTLLGLPIDDSSGKRLGHVVDVRFSGGDVHVVESTFVLYGAKSFLERLGVPRMEKKLPMGSVRGISASRINVE